MELALLFRIPIIHWKQYLYINGLLVNPLYFDFTATGTSPQSPRSLIPIIHSSFIMKGGLRIAGFCVSCLVLFSLYLLETHLQDICNQYRAGAYVVNWLDRNGTTSSPHGDTTPGDKVIVMAKLEEEHTEWVEEELPE